MNSLCKAVKLATALQQAEGLTPAVNLRRNLAIKQAKEMGLELSWRNNVPKLMNGDKNMILEMFAAAQDYDSVAEVEPSLKDKMTTMHKLIAKVQKQLDNIKELGVAMVREHGSN